MKILFVCSSNVCRSPYAEFVFKRLVENNDILKENIESVRSAAVLNKSHDIFDKTVNSLVSEGFSEKDVLMHKPAFKSTNRALFEEADVIIGMSAMHKYLTPKKYRAKFITLSEAAIGKVIKIPDPFLIKTQSAYDDVMEIIKLFLDLYANNLIDEFSANRKTQPNAI
jgi:Protein-tyrosine-phosphatase